MLCRNTLAYDGQFSTAGISTLTTDNENVNNYQLDKCSGTGYYYAALNYMAPEQSSNLNYWFSFGNSGYNNGVTSASGYGHTCESSGDQGNFVGMINWAAKYNLMTGVVADPNGDENSNYYCGGTVQAISEAEAAQYCPFLPMNSISFLYVYVF